MNKYAQLMAEERERQIDEEGWTPKHDDEHVNGELADAAVCYAATKNIYFMEKVFVIFRKYTPLFPWNRYAFFKKEKHTRKRQLIIAGALLIAELERLERADNKDA